MPFAYHSALKTPRPVTALSFASNDALSVGSDDGSVRLYNLPSTTVTRAIRGLGSEISSIEWATSPQNDRGDIWIACGNKAFFFYVNNPTCLKLILGTEDAVSTLTLSTDGDDDVNELSLSPSKQHLAFSTDGGNVGVVDIAGGHKIATMKTRHISICGCIKFIPNRPGEIVSGGYDSALLHSDFRHGGLLSRYDITPPETPSMSMSFIISLSISPTGIIAATLADGRLWVGTGGAKSATSSKQKSKKSRKWEGLRASAGRYKEVAMGPVVASAFTDGETLLTCTLLGKLAQHQITYDNEKVEIETTWNSETKDLHKVSAIAVSEKWLAIGGFDKHDKGVVEIWSPTATVEVDSVVARVEQLSVSDTQA